jgi:hypothetical protein
MDAAETARLDEVLGAARQGLEAATGGDHGAESAATASSAAAKQPSIEQPRT